MARLMDLVRKRRSIRIYSGKVVPKKLILKAIDAARFAPSGCNSQPARYCVLGKNEINNLKKAGVFYQEFVYGAPNLVVCCGDLRAYEKPEAYARQIKEGTLYASADRDIKRVFKGRERERAIRDVSVASSYFILRATELGIGTCYVGLFNERVLHKTLGLSERFVIPFVIVLGYSVQNPKSGPRKKLADLVIQQRGKYG